LQRRHWLGLSVLVLVLVLAFFYLSFRQLAFAPLLVEFEGLDALLDPGQLQRLRDFEALPGAPKVLAWLPQHLVVEGAKPTPVAETRSSDAESEIGRAECQGGRPVIFYPLRPDRRLSFYGLLFFREHEFAHHRFGHMGCSPGVPSRLGGREQELQADCEAARTLRGRPGGEAIIMAGVAHLLQINGSGSASHPSSLLRVAHLFSAECMPRP